MDRGDPNRPPATGERRGSPWQASLAPGQAFCARLFCSLLYAHMPPAVPVCKSLPDFNICEQKVIIVLGGILCSPPPSPAETAPKSASTRVRHGRETGCLRLTPASVALFRASGDTPEKTGMPGCLERIRTLESRDARPALGAPPCHWNRSEIRTQASTPPGLRPPSTRASVQEG